MREVAIAVVEFEDQFLIGQRPPHVALAGYWEFPGGKLEEGETPAEAAIRECREESGIEVSVQDAYPTVDHQYDHGLLRVHFLACSPVAPGLQPSTPFRWVPRSALLDYKFPEANAELLRSLTNR
ncbi:MAG: (deoxy)nucleoside triphosphate pyrophosphohydrolase [Planctomycetales bacterium]|nr:(deoxy)nucleoside triphosphate pyrophosphohydrolase [Planctomycetales bacterium]